MKRAAGVLGRSLTSSDGVPVRLLRGTEHCWEPGQRWPCSSLWPQMLTGHLFNRQPCGETMDNCRNNNGESNRRTQFRLIDKLHMMTGIGQVIDGANSTNAIEGHNKSLPPLKAGTSQ